MCHIAHSHHARSVCGSVCKRKDKKEPHSPCQRPTKMLCGQVIFISYSFLIIHILTFSIYSPDGTIISDEEVEWLGVGDVQQVVVGEQIAADSVVIFGSSEVDQSVLTGESVPVFKTVCVSSCFILSVCNFY